MSQPGHILVLGASGVTGIVFIRYFLSLSPSARPNLSLYLRNRSRLPEDIQSESTIRIVEGSLTDSKALAEAMSGVTVVISFLGAYMSLSNFLLRRRTPTPISDAMQVVFDAMRSKGVKRVFTLSTLSGWQQKGEENSNLSWSWYLMAIVAPGFFVPQGDAEMHGIADQTKKQDDLDWTVYRVPHLNNGDENLEVIAGHVSPDYKGSTELSRASLVKWLFQEISERKWVKGAPMLGNPY